MLRRVPVKKLSTQITSAPSPSNRSARCEPRKPAPPVIRIRASRCIREVFPSLSSIPAVNVVEANNVVLAEIAAGLHFDQLQWDLSRIGEAVHRTDWNVSRLIFVHDANRVPDRHLGGAVHDDPMLGSVQVL